MRRLDLDELIERLTDEQREELRAHIEHILSASHTKKIQEWREDFPEQARYRDFS